MILTKCLPFSPIPFPLQKAKVCLPEVADSLIYTSLSYYVIVVTIIELNGNSNMAQSSSD